MTTDDGAAGSGLGRLGAYELVRPLARGGMADVYLGRCGGPGVAERPVAIKVLNVARAQDRDACALFVDEARVVALLDHPNIAAVLAAEVTHGLHYLAMEYVDGVDLRELLAAASRRATLPSYEVALTIVAQAAAGLDHAHRRCDAAGRPLHLVHRDVSLSNIMVGHDGAVKVVDFGIARSTLSSVHTSPGVVRGKPSYMSPEQCLGDPVDHRTDVFALGIVLYELTTGARCFDGRTDFDRMLAVVRGELTLPSELVPGYPPELEQVVRTALATRPDQRYASCAHLIEALDRVLAGRGWAGGAGAVHGLMSALFGDGAHADPDAPPTVVSPTVIPPAALPTARLARGTLSDLRDPRPGRIVDEDAPTRGRAVVRRRAAA